MYLNFFARQWCTSTFAEHFKNIGKNYEIYVLTVQNDKLFYPTFSERCIKSVVIVAGNEYASFPINHKLSTTDCNIISVQLQEFIKNHPITKKDVSLQQNMKSDVETTLGIDNNVNQEKDKKITFCLNDYTSIEREKIIAFLMNIDGNSPEVYIDIDLSSCNKEQAEHLSNILLCTSSLTNT